MTRWLALLLLIALCLPSCRRKDPPPGAGGAPAAAPAAPAASAGGRSIPQPRSRTFSAAFVYVGPVGDGGWSYAHDLGRREVERRLGIHTAFVESVSEGAEAEQVIRGLARKGFDLVVGTSFGFMDAMETAAREFPRTRFVHISGHKSNGKNFGNLFGAMESMKFLAGMIAGARARMDGKTKLGYIAPFPIPEVVRLANAVMLGAQQTCPACTLEIRWINTWFDPGKEREAAESLLQAGAQVVITGADTPGPILAARDAGRWAIGYDSQGACRVAPDRCLTTPYWRWGPVYVDLVQRIRAGRWRGTAEYLDVESGIVGLYGFMPGEKLPPGLRGLDGKPKVEPPARVRPRTRGCSFINPARSSTISPLFLGEAVRTLLEEMQRGQCTRFDLFAGPIVDNRGRQVVAAGQQLTQQDLEGLPGCTVCMRWLARGIVGALPGK